MNATEGMRGRVLRAIGAEGLGQLLNMAVRLLLIPLFLSAWGTQAYGEWLILTAVAAWFSLADLGGQIYFINRMTESWAKRQMEEFQKVFAAGMFLFGVSSTVLMTLAAVALMLPGVPSWLGVENTPSSVARWVLLIVSFRVLASLPLGLLLGVYRATGAQATSVMYGNLMLLIQLVSGAAVLWWGGGMVLMACTEVIGLALVSALVAFDLRQRLPAEIRLFSARLPDMRIVRQALVPSLHFLSIQFAMAAMIQGCVIVVAKAMGPYEVAVFSTMRTIANVVSRFLGMMSHSAWPEFTRLASQKDSEKLLGLFRSIFFASVVAGLCYLTVLQLFGSDLFDIWLNKQLPYDWLSMFLMGVFVIFSSNWTLGGNLLMATNRHHDFAKIQLPVNVFALVVCYLGGLLYGLQGMVGGLIIGQSVPMIWFTAWMLARSGWPREARYMVGQSLLVALLLPLFLNAWAALLATVVFALIGARRLWFGQRGLGI